MNNFFFFIKILCEKGKYVFKKIKEKMGDMKIESLDFSNK